MKKNCEYWKSFISTGRIDDYLHYIACAQEENMDELVQSENINTQSKLSMLGQEISKQGIEKSIQSIDRLYQGLDVEKEGGFVAGIKYRDRNGSVSHAGW